MTALRVLHVVSTLKAYGAERQVFELLPALADRGVHVGAVAVYSANLGPDEERALHGAAVSVGRRGRSDYGFMPGLTQSIRAFRPDVVHTHTHVGKYWGRPAAKLAGVRALVHTEHNPCDPRRNLPERLFDRLYGAFTDRFVVFLPEQRDFLANIESIPADKIAVIPNGLDPEEPAPPGAREEKRRELDLYGDRLAIAMIARLEYQKNHELAFRAIARLAPDLRTKAVLYVIGAGPLEDDLRALSRNLGIAESTRFLGYRTDVPALLRAADVLLNTSRFEGMPMTFIEAMLARIPIVTSPWLGASSMLERGDLGFLSAGWDDGDVAAALTRALTDEKSRARCAELAAVRARSAYTLERTASAHCEVYEAVGNRVSAG
jgi:glycosyltransferase involved in cell wall biosynthesis